MRKFVGQNKGKEITYQLVTGKLDSIWGKQNLLPIKIDLLLPAPAPGALLTMNLAFLLLFLALLFPSSSACLVFSALP